MCLHRAAASGASIVCAALLAALAAGCESRSGGEQAPPPIEVGVVRVARQPVTVYDEYVAQTQATNTIELRSQVTGLLERQVVPDGAFVRKGDLLYQIDPATYRASVDNAQATLAKAEATLVSARLKAGRYHELSAIKAVSQQEADDAAASLLQAEADVGAARATLQTQRINLAYTRITAPISGRIGRSTVTPGALVTANQAAAMATVQQLDPIYVDVTQSSGTLLALKRSLENGRLKSGTAAVRLVLEDGSVYPQAGKLQFSEVTVDQNTSAVTLRAEFPNPRGDLLPGMYAKAVIEEGVIDQAVLVPQPAVSRDSTGKPVAFVVDGDGKLAQRALTTERAIGDQWLVGSGLKAGDRLVVEGQQKARPGQPVEVKAAAAPSVPVAVKTAAASAATAH